MLSPVKNAYGRLSEALEAGPRTGLKKSNISAPYVTPRSGRRLALREANSDHGQSLPPSWGTLYEHALTLAIVSCETWASLASSDRVSIAFAELCGSFSCPA